MLLLPSQLRNRRRAARALFLLAATLVASTERAAAQPPVAGNRWYQPLDARDPVGKAASWSSFRTGFTPGWFQPVRFTLPSTGSVTLYDASPARPVLLAAPAQASVLPGHVYRLRIADMPEFPGVELYPTIEVLDRLHPPVGREHEFPVPLDFTSEEVAAAASGRLVTKVIYLEQPQLAVPREPGVMLPVDTLPPTRNALAAADRAGRPLLLVRLGGRLPAVGDDLTFWGTGGPVQASVPPLTKGGPGGVDPEQPPAPSTVPQEGATP
ncbi:MAG: hypothetical protein KY476_25505 [Planctomycetes bacterium]|nr:hypothetical protein [Planctomycetota bacterium]